MLTNDASRRLAAREPLVPDRYFGFQEQRNSVDSPRIRLSAAVAEAIRLAKGASPFCHGRNLFVSIPAESLLVKKEADLSQRGPRRSRLPSRPDHHGFSMRRPVDRPRDVEDASSSIDILTLIG